MEWFGVGEHLCVLPFSVFSSERLGGHAGPPLRVEPRLMRILQQPQGGVDFLSRRSTKTFNKGVISKHVGSVGAGLCARPILVVRQPDRRGRSRTTPTGTHVIRLGPSFRRKPESPRDPKWMGLDARGVSCLPNRRNVVRKKTKTKPMDSGFRRNDEQNRTASWGLRTGTGACPYKPSICREDHTGLFNSPLRRELPLPCPPRAPSGRGGPTRG